MSSPRALEEALNSCVPEHSNAHVVNRGVPLAIDSILKGKARFARKTGAFLAVVNADNVFTLKSEIKNGVKKFKVDRILQWLELGSIIEFGPGQELAELKDFNEEDLTVTIKNDTVLDHGSNSQVLLHSVPFKTISPALKGSSIINVASRYDILIGDSVSIHLNEKLSSIKDFRVSNSTLINTISSVDGLNFIYKLELEMPLDKDLVSEEVIFLRAFPAYVSRQIVLPKERFSNNSIGSFLIDYMSGRLKEIEDTEEILSVSLFNSSNISMLGPPKKINKNYFIPSDINMESLLFWDLTNGCINLKEGIIEGETDGDGKFFLYKNILPEINCDISWTVKFRSTVPLTARIDLHPKNFVEVQVTSSNVLTPLVVERLASDNPTKRIEVVVIGQPYSKFQIKSWLLNTSVPKSLSYSLLARVTSLVDWQATGIMVKPFFYTLDYLRASTEIKDNDLAILHT